MDRKWLVFLGMAVLLDACTCGDDDPPPPAPKFHVGGTITGLTAPLTLQLNGSESLTRSADGAFTFQTELEDQSSYAVALTPPPADQDCTLQNASGKVDGADVTNVQVTCAQKTYSLGGTVTGLNGSLQLRIEGGETLTVNGSNAFTFQARFTRGTVLHGEPRGPAQGPHAAPSPTAAARWPGTSPTSPCSARPEFRFAPFRDRHPSSIGQSNFTASPAEPGRVHSRPHHPGRPLGQPRVPGRQALRLGPRLQPHPRLRRPARAERRERQLRPRPA